MTRRWSRPQLLPTKRWGIQRVLEGVFHASSGGVLTAPEHETVALAVEQWLRRDPDATARATDDFADGLHGRIDPRLESWFLTALAEGYARADRAGRAAALNERAADPWCQRALFALRRSDAAAARAAVERAGEVAPHDHAVGDLRTRLGLPPLPGPPPPTATFEPPR